ncbi:4-hydroxybutyryl-CoA dehydratase/vinylacetyl-CoA-Delta-isomerase [Peptoniphilus sp. ING2-D1G]|nr:4-hydroxybutyryl-CoA dehydratase/vinylacetyl-CoA-Delta-isomerase [Peptoniphilus sp. ING2-D1G]
MARKTGAQYEESIRALNMNVYMFGEKIEKPLDHPILRPSFNSVKATYEFADSKSKDLFVANSPFIEGEVNRFNHIHESADDLVKKVTMQRFLGQKTAACFQRCVGMDGMNAVFSTTYEIDDKYSTRYHERFVKYLKYIQENDLVVDGAMTDPKGDRGKSPSAQDDPDLYLHVVERREDGIVVRGAKAHQTGATNSHEILVMPTVSMKPEDKDYSVSFAVPVDAPGIVMIIGRQSCDTRKLEDSPMDVGNLRYGGMEALIVFDDVFVPNDRIFMDGETDFSGMLVERFAGYHRQSYACKTGVGDVLIGAAALAADYNGVPKASHIKDKLIEMNHLNETIWSSALACSYSGWKTSSGNYMCDLLLANVCKQNVTRFPYEISRLAQDIAGGMMVTTPSEKDFKSEAVGKYVEKYLKGVSDISTEDRIRIMRLIENLSLGTAAVGYLTESMHGAGSPQAQRIMIARQSNMEEKKRFAKHIAMIKKS